ncbi:MarR family winged helix-turn-helix transcriptional regulator [Salipaludibacillus sp. CF4.18]|uniref:MarR family winged helix-turn-helix transcriptional regulator n=1 Tax=Salipaludibacillus sp. CF4.18 TaxID=3373081 RepID=UPI003EE49A7A
MNESKMEDLIEQYANVYLFATKNIEKVLAEKVFPMSVEQYGILRLLDMNGPQTAKELAELTGVHKSAITTKTSRLEEKGLIKRNPDLEDRRHIQITLTEEGHIVFEQSKQAMIAFISSYFTRLDSTEVESFLKIYQKINTIIIEEESEEQ